MPGFTMNPDTARPWTNDLLLELAVPGLSFGGVVLALVSAGTGYAVDIRYFGLGCVFASFILAYLAWIRPRRDLVSLTMPLYAVLIFIVPSDLVVDIVLELLYAVSLTLVLIRLKYRFGTARGLPRDNRLDGPLGRYCESVSGHLAGTDPETARAAALSYLHAARTDYSLASGTAGHALAVFGHSEMHPALKTAFAIVRQQAQIFEDHGSRPDEYYDFSPAETGLLAKPVSDKDHDARFERAFENALLLLFAAGLTSPEDEIKNALLSERDSAVRLAEDTENSR